MPRDRATKDSAPVAARLVLVRHAATDWSEQGRHTGRTDIALNEAGRRGAAFQLRPKLIGRDVVAVFTSPLKRAVETCEIAGFGDRAETCDELLEWDYGDYEGLTTAEIHEARPHWELFADGCPNGEVAADVGGRVDWFFDRISISPEGEGDVLCFAHGHLLRVAAARWVELAPEQGRRFVFEPAHIGILGFERQTWTVSGWNL